MLYGSLVVWVTLAHIGLSHGQNGWSLCTGNVSCSRNESSCTSFSPLVMEPKQTTDPAQSFNRLVFPTLTVCDACAAGNPCHNGGLCKNVTRDAYYCSCRVGYRGNVCEQKCDCTEPGEECGSVNGSCVCEANHKKNSAGKCKRFCEPATLQSSRCNMKNYTFPVTTVNSLAHSNEKCGNRGEATVKCALKTDGTYGFDPAFLSCTDCNITIHNITQLVQENATFESTLSTIALLTSTNETIPKKQASATVAYLDETSKVVKNTTVADVYHVMVIAENVKVVLTNDDSTADETSVIEDRKKVVSSIENFGLNLNLENETTVVIETDTMIFQASKPAVVTKNNKKEYNEVTFPEPTAELSVTPKTTHVLFTIPKTLIEEMSTKAVGGTLQLVFVLHKDDSLFTNGSRVNEVVQASFNHKEGDSTAFAIPFTIEHNHPRLLTKEENKTQQFQEQKIKVVRNEVEEDLFSTIACSISIVGLIMTMVIYLAIPELRKRKPTPILVNFCICLAIGYLFFVVGIDKARYQQDNAELNVALDYFCYASSIMMHTGLLSAWFWMLVYSVNIYYAMVRVVGHSSFVGRKLFMYAVGYALPIIMVAVNFIVAVVLDKKKEQGFGFESAYRAPYMCWIYKYSLYAVFLLPVGIILLINFVLFFLVLRKLTWNRKEIQSNRQSLNWKQQMVMAVSMMAMMGLTWIFGFLMLVISNQTYVMIMGTLFNICNTTQGIIIFLVSCVRQKNVRDMWLLPLLRTLGCYKCIHPKGAEPLSSSQAYSSNTTKNMSTLPRGSNATTLLKSDTTVTSKM